MIYDIDNDIRKRNVGYNISILKVSKTRINNLIINNGNKNLNLRISENSSQTMCG
jgi:hypothetical protein